MSDTEKELRQAVQELSAELERIGQASLELGSVLCYEGKKLVVVTANSTRLVEAGNHKPGELVYIVPMTGQIYGTVKAKINGPLGTISRISEHGVYVSQRGENRLVTAGLVKNLEKGDVVMLDPTGSVIVSMVERAPKPYVPQTPTVLWGDIGGCEGAKRALQMAVEAPYKHPKLFERYGKRPPAGVLLYGPPGCGKTMLGKAVATSINGNAGKEGGFFAIKGPEILDPYVGVAEANVRAVFQQAREYKAEHGRPAVIFVDEAEAILGHRGTMYAQMEKTIVPTFLTEMDGLEESSAIVMLCTNRKDLLDPAVIRDGRIDVKVEIGRPNRKEGQAILAIYFAKIEAALAKPLCADKAAEIAAASLYGAGDSGLPYSGAMIAAVVDRSKASALNRDLTQGGKFSGITTDDIAVAVSETYAQDISNQPSQSARALIEEFMERAAE